MNKILSRIINAYKTKGIEEIWRKLFFLIVYRICGVITRLTVKYSVPTYGLNTSYRKEKIIISLTSYPQRFPFIGNCLKSLLLQKTKPDKIIVYLGSDSREKDLTPEMIMYKKYGVEYKFDKFLNLKPHKKYFYAMQEFPNDIVVTADDDIIYPNDWLSSLLNSYEKYPNAISARRVHLMRYDKERNLLPYNLWIDQCRSVRKPSHDLLATGGSGTLYPPSCLVKETFDYKKIISISLNADDIWLKIMELISNMPVVWVPNISVEPISIANNTEKLTSKNVFNANNDIYINSLMEYYKNRIHQYSNDKNN